MQIDIPVYLGDFAEAQKVRITWGSRDSSGASITRSTDGTVRVYKDGSTTQRSSSAGITDTEDWDSLTGLHHVTIDLADNTDAGFYEAGHEYFVVLEGATIDGQAVNLPLAHFSINRVGTWSYAAIMQAGMTEGYAADGSNPTPEQMLFMIYSAVSQFVVTGTSIDCKKLDGSTSAMTFTTDDASNPTQRIRSA